MSLSDSRLSSFSLYPWNPGIASSIFSWRLVWDFARSKYGFVVELKLRPFFIVENKICPDSLLRVSKPNSRKNRNEIIFLRNKASTRQARRRVLFSHAATVVLSIIFLLNRSIQKSCRSFPLGPSFQKNGYRTTMFTDTF